jgi:purine nucleoside permease
MLKVLAIVVALFWCGLGGASGQGVAAATPIKIKVVVVTTFEVGEDTGDAPGEFQYWVEREKLTEKMEFPGGVRGLRINAAHDVLGVVTGMTLANAGPSIVALGLDPRFDLTHAYWLVDGIAGVDPADGTIGTAAWASWVVNDVNRQLDSAEMPKGWPYGLFVIGAKGPGEMPAKPMTDNAYPLNAGLAGWAYGLTKDVKIPDSAVMAADRTRWVGFPEAMKGPTVIRGDSYASDSYWHGAVMTRYANDWVSQWTKGKGNFAMANMEDAAIAEGLLRLDRMHKADYSRLMVLRVGSNYTMQAPGQTAVQSVTSPYIKSTAYEDCWVVGSVVVRELVGHWGRYEGMVPGMAVSTKAP